MFKMIGALLVIGGCGYGGLSIARGYRLRAEVLRSLQNGLNLLEAEISYGSTPLPLALERVGEKLGRESSLVFSYAAQAFHLHGGATAGEAWEEGVKKLAQNVSLSLEDISILQSFGQGLGNSAKNEQLKNIALAREQLFMAEKEACLARERYERMWRYLGFCLGAAIVLALI
ncbi:MAG: stage III sporulation protein AB [Peptococcaceae bacterium]|jgi:stage III sporulation protein AB|nr:stage III sporulation protein AB [Peptococcaceae bacterium]MDH7525354.1 stage III sporulation protein AB [Peptococcaceae bacterium]